jgi:hypothetical protein
MNKQLFLTLFFISYLSFACKKDSNPTVATKSAEELLTAHTWKIDELRYVYRGVLEHYVRGVHGNVDYFANEYLKFNPDHTGNNDNLTSLTWQFIDAAKTKLTFTINFTTEAPLVVNWEHVVLTENSITFSEYWTRADGPSCAFGTRSPK